MLEKNKKDYVNKTEIKNFLEENNDINNIYWYIRIGDFELNKDENDKKIIEEAKIGFSIYWVNSLEGLKKSKKNIIIVIPALTWNAKIFSEFSSQWDGWANTYWKKWNILDPNKNIIIGLDYFGGPYDSSAPDKHNLDFYPVPAIKQVEAWKKAIKTLWIERIYALFWGSNGWWHIHDWIFDWELIPEKLIPVAWPIAPTLEAREFFKLQADFIKNKENVSFRLRENLRDFTNISELYDFLVWKTCEEIDECIWNWENKKAIKITRQIWFLKFLNPSFFDKFYYDKNWIKLENIKEAQKNLMNYFENEWIKFEKRFSLSSLALLSESIALAKRISPDEYVEKIPENIDLIIVSIEDDNLFETKPMQEYFTEVRELRKEKWHLWKIEIVILKSNENTKKAGHDAFLWPEEMQKISKLIMQKI